ncbi:hypothetical protein J4456_00285 [Candidatus Pacearchaeota archaeon]|nr:hypothetical protein [Candidatus Pacearchaeota archaeon]
MQKAKDYLSLEGWKADLEETVRDVKDTGILVKRMLGLSHYGFKNGGEMTSRELKDFIWRTSALWFKDDKEFQIYAMTNKLPLGRCLIGWGKNERRYDDTLEIPKGNYQNIPQLI